jgi:hypothetical protein
MQDEIIQMCYWPHICQVKVVPYTSGKISSARLIFLFFLEVCLNISTAINIKILTISNQQTQSYKFTSHIAAFLSVVLITEMLEICIQTSYDQNVQLILKSYLPVVYGTIHCIMIWLSYLLTMSLPDEGYSINTLCARKTRGPLLN